HAARRTRAAFARDDGCAQPQPAPARPLRTGSCRECAGCAASARGGTAPLADRWYNPALVPHDERWQLALPGAEAVRAYLLETLESTLELLDKTADDDASLYFYRVALFHEDLRCEQLVTLAQTLGLPLKLALPVG